MRIIVTNSDFQSSFIGGITRVCVNLAQQWVKQGHDVLFVSANDKNVPNPHLIDFRQVVLPNGMNHQSEANYNAFLQTVQDFKADVILHPFVHDESYTDMCLSIRKNTGTRLVLAWHFAPTHYWDIMNRNFFIPMQMKASFLRAIYDVPFWLRWNGYRKQQVIKRKKSYFRKCIAESDSFVVLSSLYIRDLENIVGKHSNKAIAINNPVIFDVPSQIDYAKKEKIVLWIGRIGYDMKRTDKMLNIWKRISRKYPDWHLIVCGPGETADFAAWCQKKGMTNVEFPGVVQVEDYYQHASILCNTSVTEGMPLVVMEAMEYGCVPMAFDSYRSVHDIIVNGETGYVIPAFDEDVYAAKLGELIENAQLRQQMAEAGRVLLTRFDKNLIAEQWIRLFNPLR